MISGARIELLDKNDCVLSQWPCTAPEFFEALAAGEHAATKIPPELGRGLGNRVARIRCVDENGRTFEGPAFSRTRQ